jgi:vacuolar-type H+-ATPase subunit I/STV1
MAHNEHNKQRRGGGFFLIIFGALLFIISPTYLSDSPELGGTAIIFGFIVGGIGFYLQFIKNRSRSINR